jgi:cytochrome P450
MRRLTEYLLGLVRRRRADPRDDLLSELAGSAELSDLEIAGSGVLLLTAGHETIAGMLGLSVFALLSHPEQLARLRDGSASKDAAVEELLRYLTIFQFGVPRSPLEDIELDGQLIRAGETVTVSLPAANRDPQRFECPDELDLARSARGHLAFGYGVHQCIGQNLARMELHVALPALFERLPGLRLAVPDGEVPLSHDAGFYGVLRLPAAW